jgi:hypothetical protein
MKLERMIDTDWTVLLDSTCALITPVLQAGICHDSPPRSNQLNTDSDSPCFDSQIHDDEMTHAGFAVILAAQPNVSNFLQALS